MFIMLFSVFFSPNIRVLDFWVFKVSLFLSNQFSIFLSSSLTTFSTGDELLPEQAARPDKLHNHSDHVLIRAKPQQLAGKTTTPDSVISSCQINKYGTGLLFSLKKILDVLG